MFKWKKATAAAVVLFVIAITWSFTVEAQTRVVTGLGAGYAKSKGQVTQVIGVNINDRWIVEYERLGGHGHTKSNALTAARRVYFLERKRVLPFFELGGTYFDRRMVKPDSDLRRAYVGEKLTFHLSVGTTIILSHHTDLNIRLARHNSVAGRHKDNTGLDRADLTFTWRM